MSSNSNGLVIAWTGGVTLALLAGIMFGIGDSSGSDLAIALAAIAFSVASIMLTIAMIATAVKIGIQAARN